MEIKELSILSAKGYFSLLSDLNSFHISERGSKFWDLPLFCFPSLTLELKNGFCKRSRFEQYLREVKYSGEYLTKISYLIPPMGNQGVFNYDVTIPTIRLNRFSDFHCFLYKSCLGQITWNRKCILDINQEERTHSILYAHHGCIVSEANKILLAFCIKVDSYMDYFSSGRVLYSRRFGDLDKVIWVSEELFEPFYKTFCNKIFNKILKPFLMIGGEVKMFTKEELDVEFYTSKNIKKTLFKETFKEIIRKGDSSLDCLDVSDIQDVIIHRSNQKSLYMKL